MPTTSYRPHLKYRNINADTKEALVDLFRANPWGSSSFETGKLEVAIPYMERICQTYNVATPEFRIDPCIWGRFSYRRGTVFSLSSTTERTSGVITLRAFSLLSMLTALRKHINTHTGSRLDEFAWACSAFYSVRPVRFRRLVREDRVVGLVARDTYTTETWERLVAEGQANPETGWYLISEMPSDETVAAAAEYVDALIEDEASEGVTEIENYLNGEDDGLDGCNRDALRRLAAEHNIPGRGSMLANELRCALRERGIRV